MSWYVIDPLFHNDNNLTPDHIKGDPMQKNNLMRQVLVSEVFPNKQLSTGQLNNIPVLDLAYYPQDRGPYNYDTPSGSALSAGVEANGELKDPDSRWAGVMRTLTTNDFEAANIEYIQFWVMDPFSTSASNSFGEPATNEDSQNSTGGELYFNLGNISEDILRDGRKSYENGLPTDGVYDPEILTETAWGWIPTSQVIVNAFDNDVETRPNQDVGFDGLKNEDERDFSVLFFLLRQQCLTPAAYAELSADPSSDDYNYFRDDSYDANELDILRAVQRI